MWLCWVCETDVNKDQERASWLSVRVGVGEWLGAGVGAVLPGWRRPGSRGGRRRSLSGLASSSVSGRASVQSFRVGVVPCLRAGVGAVFPGCRLPVSPGGRRCSPSRLSLLHFSEPTRLLSISYSVFFFHKNTLPCSLPFALLSS